MGETALVIGVVVAAVTFVAGLLAGRLTHPRPMDGRWRLGRLDDVFADAAPGDIGMQTRRAVPYDYRMPVPVRFVPPEGMAPQHCGLAMHREVRPADIASALVSLAVGGYLTLRREGADDWRIDMCATVPRTPLTPTELAVRAVLPPPGQGTTFSAVRCDLAGVIDAERSRLSHVPPATRWLRGAHGAVSSFAFVVTALALAVSAWSVSARGTGLLCVILLAWAGFLCGFAATAGSRPRGRTALGSALVFQTQGFAQYLAAASGGRLQSQEGAVIFSRYLPWAVALGTTREWTNAFAEAAREAEPAETATWAADLAWYGDLGPVRPAAGRTGLDRSGLDRADLGGPDLALSGGGMAPGGRPAGRAPATQELAVFVDGLGEAVTDLSHAVDSFVRDVTAICDSTPAEPAGR